jgi:hypothetical protein
MVVKCIRGGGGGVCGWKRREGRKRNEIDFIFFFFKEI